jgi:sugar/nucleoside kinase (ribokinase family)
VGGACTYIALAASYFVKPINLVSVVGDDFPQSELDYLQSRGVDLAGLQVKEGEKSFFWAGRYHDNMNKRDTLDTQLNVLADFNPMLPATYKEAKYLMLGNLTPDVQMQVLNQMTRRPKLVVLDTMNFWMDIAMPSLKAVLKKVDVLAINEEEARQLSGEYALIKAARVIREMGPKILIIKKGEHGALLFYKDEVFFAPALPLEVVFDPTGAGDTFAGGFIGYLAKTNNLSFANLKRAIIVGSAMASFCVEKYSVEGLKGLTQAQIQQRVNQFVSLTKFNAKL